MPVVNEGLWQCTQPILAKASRPFSLDGVAGAGAGGANMRMKLANASMSEMTAGFEMPATLSMKPQTTVLINREATKHDVDKWMEDLFARIQLCVMHPHSVIQRDGTTNEQETMFQELRTTGVPIGTQDHKLQSTSCRR